MVDYNGDWFPEKNYENYPKRKWCDLDYIANWIIKQNYKPSIGIKNLTERVLEFYYSEDFANGDYFAVKDERGYPDNLMVNVDDVGVYVEECGGLREFDWFA